MKFLPVLGLLVATVCLIEGRVQAASPDPNCPVPDELGGNVCQCFSPLKYFSCDKIANSFNLKKDYSFNRFTIRNAASLTKIDGQQADPKFKFHVQDLVVIQDDASPADIAFMDNLEPILAISTKSVKILSEASVTDTLDVSTLPDNLESLIIEEVKMLSGFVARKFSNLKQLILRNVKLAEATTDLTLLDSPHMTTLEITNVQNLNGVVTFRPTTCPADEKIHIKLSETGLIGFDLSALFITGKHCKYHIELSSNAFPVDYFSKQALALLQFDRKSLYLSLESKQDATCTCPAFNAWEKHKGYIYGIKCAQTNLKPGKAGYLEKVKREDFSIACAAPTGH